MNESFVRHFTGNPNTYIEIVHCPLNANMSLASLGSSLAASTLPTLKSIVLHTAGSYKDGIPLRGLDHALQEIAGRNALVELQVLITVFINSKSYVPSGDFSNLDRVLTEDESFPELRQVTIELTRETYHTVGQYNDLWPPQNSAEEQFPHLYSSPTIDFTYSYKDH